MQKYGMIFMHHYIIKEMNHDKEIINENRRSIFFVTISMQGGGTERVIATLANYWIVHGYAVTILMIGGDNVAYKLNDGIVVKCVSSATGGDLIARMDRIRAMRDCFKSDPNATVIAMGSVASMFASVALCGLSNRFIASERNDPNRLNYRPIKPYERTLRNLLYTRADNLVFQTRMAMDCFPRKIRKKGYIIMNPLAEDLPRPSEYSGRKKAVITAGRLNEKKNLWLLIDAFVEFHRLHGDYELLIYGDGESRKRIEDYISEHNLSNYVSMKGFTDSIIREMDESRIYVSSSDSEGISNSLMEALAMGMAVIATDCPVGGSKMLIEDGINGRLIEVGDKEGLVKALNEVSDTTIAEKYAKKAVEIRDENAVSAIVARWEKLI